MKYTNPIPFILIAVISLFLSSCGSSPSVTTDVFDELLASADASGNIDTTISMQFSPSTQALKAAVVEDLSLTIEYEFFSGSKNNKDFNGIALLPYIDQQAVVSGCTTQTCNIKVKGKVVKNSAGQKILIGFLTFSPNMEQLNTTVNWFNDTIISSFMAVGKNTILEGPAVGTELSGSSPVSFHAEASQGWLDPSSPYLNLLATTFTGEKAGQKFAGMGMAGLASAPAKTSFNGTETLTYNAKATSTPIGTLMLGTAALGNFEIQMALGNFEIQVGTSK